MAIMTDPLELLGAAGVHGSKFVSTQASERENYVVFARYVVAVEPLASMSGDEIADWLGPTFDLYLTGPMDDSALGRSAVA